MGEQGLPRILVVDDEEAILETMTFTFEGEYEVLTSSDARRALEILEEKAPIAVVLTDPASIQKTAKRTAWQNSPTPLSMCPAPGPSPTPAPPAPTPTPTPPPPPAPPHR